MSLAVALCWGVRWHRVIEMANCQVMDWQWQFGFSHIIYFTVFDYLHIDSCCIWIYWSRLNTLRIGEWESASQAEDDEFGPRGGTQSLHFWWLPVSSLKIIIKMPPAYKGQNKTLQLILWLVNSVGLMHIFHLASSAYVVISYHSTLIYVVLCSCNVIVCSLLSLLASLLLSCLVLLLESATAVQLYWFVCSDVPILLWIRYLVSIRYLTDGIDTVSVPV